MQVLLLVVSLVAIRHSVVFQLNPKYDNNSISLLTFRSCRKTLILKSPQITCFVASFDLSFIMGSLNIPKNSSLG